jgi:hypothetical protein
MDIVEEKIIIPLKLVQQEPTSSDFINIELLTLSIAKILFH